MAHNAVRSQASLAGNAKWFGLYKYPSHGNYYYRLQWGVGRKVLGQLHVRGGAVGNELVESRASRLAQWIREGRQLSQCKQLVSSWDKKTAKGDTRGKPRRAKKG
ncbi:hypothetical protein Lepto7375DRAFT_7778 [Leptolyngbya sp. PCC 7375]|nr:hypothetical protein Lepto7375DRAFT_7778 [Leptolyngbya sp. PCC 7375]